MVRRALVTFAAVLFLALALPPTLSAQNVFVLGGATIGTDDYGDAVDTGWMISGGVSIGLGN